MLIFPVVVLLLVATASYRFIILPVFVSPLAKIPNAHWSCSFTSLWLLWIEWNGRENDEVYQAHMRRGPAVRLGPATLSINCFENGLKTIYQGGFPKPAFYWHGFAVYNSPNLFTIPDNATHSAQKRILSHSFSKSNILGSGHIRLATRDVLFARVIPLLHKAAKSGQPIEAIEFNYSYFLDTFVQWQFGKAFSSNLVEDETERRMYLDGFFGVADHTFWQYNFSKLTSALRRIGINIIPETVIDGFAAVEDWNLRKCDQSHQLLASGKPLADEDRPYIFEQAMKGMSNVHAGPGQYPSRLNLASEMFSLNSGAFETSGNTTSYIMYELSRNPPWQTRLREELRGITQPVLIPDTPPSEKIESSSMTNPKTLDELPILSAIIQETLRRWPSVPGGQPRVVPQPCTLAGYANIPAGTIVQAYAGTLHRTPEIFPEPWSWKPERWLDADSQQLALMKRWSWGFGSGGRGCLGNHFALYGEFLFASDGRPLVRC